MPPVRPTTPEPLPPPEPRCDDVTLAEPPEEVMRDDFGSLWRHNCSIMGLVADLGSGRPTFGLYRPKRAIEAAVASDPVLFRALTGAAASLAPRTMRPSAAASSVFFAVERRSGGGGRYPQSSGSAEIAACRQQLPADWNRPRTPLEFSFVETISPRRIKPRSRGPGTSTFFGAHAQLLGDYLLSRCAGADRG